MIRVLIVARLPIIREGLRGLLASERDFHVSTLARFESGELVEDILSDRPDVVLLDVEVLEHEGWALLGDLRTMAPHIASLVISDTAEDRRVASALAMGAHGYILRGRHADGDGKCSSCGTEWILPFTSDRGEDANGRAGFERCSPRGERTRIRWSKRVAPTGIDRAAQRA